ncbi:MAG TPA: nucleotidyltransferase family protein [Tenericutes bacterium]|nr:nucleotidyltransferase family protein [Mycoplasmatota bacterium]
MYINEFKIIIKIGDKSMKAIGIIIEYNPFHNHSP